MSRVKEYIHQIMEETGQTFDEVVFGENFTHQEPEPTDNFEDSPQFDNISEDYEDDNYPF